MRELRAGERIGGRYVLQRRLGLGGMGEVWLATLEGAGAFRRRVVLKVLTAERRGDERVARMLSDEARVVGLLHHPGIVAALDYLETPGEGPVFVLDYVDGASLRTALRSARRRKEIMPEVLAAHVGACVARALHAAHSALDAEAWPLGIVHRDVAPDNVLLSRAGMVYLGDFGVARAAGNSEITQPGAAPKGKRGYMAPEQAMGRAVGPSADVFSLGRVIAEAADLHCGPALREVIDKATADDPGERFQTAAEFAAALVQVCPPPPDPEGELAAWLQRVAPEAMGARETNPGGTPQTAITPPPAAPRTATREPMTARVPSDPPPPLFHSIAPEQTRSGLKLLAAAGILLALLLPLAAIYALGQGGHRRREPGLRPQSGEVRVRSQPEAAEVFVDGAKRGVTPLLLVLPTGKHAVRVGNARLDRWRTTDLVVRDNVRQELQVDLAK